MNSVIVVAGGKGLRMGADLPKQFIEINGKSILHHTLLRFYEALPDLEIIVAIHPSYQEYWENYCIKNMVPIHQLVHGGKERFDSINNALQLIAGEEEGVVGVHDAVRPLVSVQTIRELFEVAKSKGAVIPVTPVTDSLRKTSGNDSEAVERKCFVAVQTPQCFNVKILKKAYVQPYQDFFTDDASVVEFTGEKIHLIQGNVENIKLTTPKDLILAKELLL